MTPEATVRVQGTGKPAGVRLPRPASVRLWVWVGAAALAWTGAVRAQQPITGTISGRVTDGSGASLPAAAVTLRSERGATSLTTDSSGRFLIPYLTPGSYSVRVERKGFAAVERPDVEVRLGQRVELLFSLPAGGFAEAIDVRGSSPVLDFSSAASATSLDGGLLAQVPARRTLGEILYVAPGVSGGGGTGTPNPSISGGSGLENQYVVDGVVVNAPRHGTLGVYSEDYGALGSGVTFDFIDEVQTRTGGVEAEYAQSTGGLVNVLTKTGTNQWHGGAFAYLQPAGLEGDRKAVSLVEGATNTEGQQDWDAGLTLGGPLLRDRAFFFLAVNPQSRRATFIAPAGFPLRALGGVDRERRSTSYAGKATLEWRTDHRFDVSFFGDPGESGVGPQSPAAMLFTTTSAFSALAYGTEHQSLRYQGILTPTWLVEASVARARVTFEEAPSVDEWQVTDETTTPTTSTGGRGAFEKSGVGTSWQYQAKATHVLGAHDVRYGASWEGVRSELVSAHTGPTFTLANGRRTGSGALITVLPDPTYGRIYRVTRSRLGVTRVADEGFFGAFLQDRVAVSDRLSLSAGIRYERQRLEGGASGFTFGDNWAPRLGLVLDPTGKGRMKAFASFGVFFAKIPSELTLTAFNALQRVVRADYFDAALTQPVPDGVPAAGSTTHLLLQGERAAAIDPTTKITYIRELAAGFEMQAGDRLSLGVRYLHRDMPRIVEDVGTAAMIYYFSHDPAFQSVEYVITNPRDGYPRTVNGVGAFQDPIHRYDAVELTADKRFSDNWVLLASYRWSRLWGTYEGLYDNPTLHAKPAESSLLDFPTDDPTFTSIGGPLYGFRGDIRYQGRLGAGPLPNDCPHQVKVYGAYAFDGGLTVGAGVAGASGRPLTPYATDAVNNRQGAIPEARRGAGILTEDGFRTRTPFLWSFDLHGDYAFHVKPGIVRVTADVTNLFNNQDAASYDQNTQRQFGVTNPDFGRITAYQEPRQIRLGLRFEL